MTSSRDIDTYANLLYKDGRTREAIEWETKAVEAEETAAAKSKRTPDKTFSETLEKMRRGVPTWSAP